MTTCLFSTLDKTIKFGSLNVQIGHFLLLNILNILIVQSQRIYASMSCIYYLHLTKFHSFFTYKKKLVRNSNALYVALIIFFISHPRQNFFSEFSRVF